MSGIITWGMSSCRSSHAVSLAPWLLGLVSLTYTRMFFLFLWASLIGARALPQSTKARAPALQWVIIFAPFSIRGSPFSPIFLPVMMYSSAIFFASSTIIFSFFSGDMLGFNLLRTRSMSWKRFTAVGLVFFNVFSAILTWLKKEFMSFLGAVKHACAIP